MVYLDNAATTFPKPLGVGEEVYRTVRDHCGNPGRGGHALARSAAEKVYACREKLARMFSAEGPENVIFTQNTTHALNIAIKGLVPRGGHIMISDLEHNSVRRPAEAVRRAGLADYSVFSSFAGDAGYERELDTARILSDISAKLRRNTRLLVCTAMSNIAGLRMPLSEIGAFCHSRGVLFAVDAAQGAGHMPIDMKAAHIDALCVPGQKGLYGIPGVGALMLASGVMPTTLLEGGSGSASLDLGMPSDIPERYEAGTLPLPAISALSAGLDFVNGVGIGEISRHEEALCELCISELSKISGVTFYCSKLGPTLIFNLRDIPSDILAAELDAHGICVRGGFHCAPLAHKTLGTPEHGAVRVSFSYFNTEADVLLLADALKAI